MAYVLMCALRRIGLHDTDFAQATCGTIRLKFLKIGALVRISVRRIRIAMASVLSGRPRLGTCRDPSRHHSHRPRLARKQLVPRGSRRGGACHCSPARGC